MTKADGLGEVVQTWRTGAEQEDAAKLAALHEQAAEAVAAGRAASPRYAAFAAQHGARLRADQVWLKDRVLERSRWVLQVVTARERGKALLDLLEGNPPLIAKHLGEIAGMTTAYARSHRLGGTLIPALLGMAETATQLDGMLAVYDDSDDGVRALIRRLRAETPDLAPRPVLASAESDGPPSGPRRAKSGLSGGGDD